MFGILVIHISSFLLDIGKTAASCSTDCVSFNSKATTQGPILKNIFNPSDTAVTNSITKSS